MKNKLRNFVSSATDADEKYFRQAIWQYVQLDEKPESFKSFMAHLAFMKPNKTNIPSFVLITRDGHIINEGFYDWATDVKNSLQKLVK